MPITTKKEQVNLFLPKTTAQKLRRIPRGQRPQIVSRALNRELKLFELEKSLEDFYNKYPPITIQRPDINLFPNQKNKLLDTNILIYLFNQDPKAKNFILSLIKEGIQPICSYLSKFELLCGTKDKKEDEQINKLLDNFLLISVNNEVIQTASKLWKELYLKKGIKIRHSIDLFIAATAISLNIPLVTANYEDFKSFEELKLERF